MNFQQLEYIIAVDKHRHFAKAAESCFVTQATLSAMIRKLEEELEVVIFDRKKYPVVTTDEGREVIGLAKKILAHKTEMREIASSDIGNIEGDLTIGIIPTIANALLPVILKPILETYPLLNVKLVEITTEEIIRQLKSEEIDTGILATPLLEDTIEENILYYEAMMVYGIKEKDRKFVLPEDLEEKDIWLLEEGHCFRNQSLTICNIKEKTNLQSNLKFEGNSFDTLLNLTDQFGGYTLVPELYYNLMTPTRKKKTRQFETPMPVREVSIVYYRPHARKTIISALTELIQSLIRDNLITSKHKSSELSIIGI